MSGQEGGGGPVTLVVARTPREGRERELEEWLAGIVRVASTFPGHLGAVVVRPHAGQREYVLVARYASEADLARWRASDECAAWLARGDALCDAVEARTIVGLEAWFTLPDRPVPPTPPPPWKIAALTWGAIFPLILTVTALLGPFMARWPLVLRAAVTSALLVSLMTWVVMPRMTRAFRRWLYPGV